MGNREEVPAEVTRRVRELLPKFPDEVIQGWIGHYANILGWPPSQNAFGFPTGRWDGILLGVPVVSWAELDWRGELIELAAGDLTLLSRQTIYSMRAAYTGLEVNPYSEIVDGRDRFNRAADFVRANGTIPGSVVALRENRRLRLVDGHHRVAAYFHVIDESSRQGGLRRFGPMQVWVAR